MMINALKFYKDLNAELITFSDDMDGLRKVPENISNSKILKKTWESLCQIFQILSESIKVLANIITKC